jgi:outer membrane protein assembly factor BamB
VLFHHTKEGETLDCLEAETGKRFWRYSYQAEYTDDFGYGDGPRAGPVISGGKVYTFGITSWLKCVDLATGKLVWEVDCQAKYAVPKYFFGSGSSPLVQGSLLLVNVGGGDGQCVIAFDKETGAEKWIVKHPWGQSYSSPITAKWHGTDRVLFFTGGKSEPSTGGLIVVDPATGKLESTFPWRARRYPSVNAASPVLCGENQVFISHAYVDRDHDQNGGVMLQTDADGKLSAVWNQPTFGCHWMTPIYHNGHLYAFSGEKERSCELVCHEAATGKQLWHEKMEWEAPGRDGQTLPMSLYRASLLQVGTRFLCLGEWGTLCWLDLSPAGAKRLSTAQLFTAQQSWTLPALSRGLLFVMQNEDDRLTGTPPRLMCYDLRAAP